MIFAKRVLIKKNRLRRGLIAAAFLFAAGFGPSTARAATEVADRDQLRERMGVSSYAPYARLPQVKIAVLDNGFDGFDKDKGLLPATAERLDLTQYPAAASRHGLGMAQIIWAVTGQQQAGPKFYLINSNGFSNFKAAVDYVIKNKIDIVLYSQVWPFGGNFDGTGFINEQVTRATQAGVIWINAAGNNHGLVYNGEVVRQRDPATSLMKFTFGDYLRFENKLDESEVTITLSWTDFTGSELYNTSKDLDLFVYDEQERLVGSGELIQKGEAPPAGTDSKLSSHARESVTLRGLERGNYRIRIKARSNNFSATDRFRVLLKTDKQLVFHDASADGEIMPPADHPNVITVGERGDISSDGPTADGRSKPDVLLDDATVAFTNGARSQGSSNAAALVAGAVALMKAEAARLDFWMLRQHSEKFREASYYDLYPADASALDPWVRGLIPDGSRVMRHTRGRYVILTAKDPLEYTNLLQAGAYRKHWDDMVLVHAFQRRFATHPRSRDWEVFEPWVEFRQKESHSQLKAWKAPTPSELHSIAGN